MALLTRRPGRAVRQPLRAPRRSIASLARAVGAVLAGAAVLLTTTGAQTRAAPTVASPHEVYAAFTLNLTRFITWPASVFPSPDAPLVIGTFPRDPINDELDAAARGETVNGHPIRAVRLQSLEDVAKCHVIFMSQATPRQSAVLQRAAGKPILLIGDGDGFLELGGHVRFVSQPPRIGLRISVDNLRASGLQARSQLLQIAAAP